MLSFLFKVYVNAFQISSEGITYTLSLPPGSNYVIERNTWFKEVRELVKNFQRSKVASLRRSHMEQEEREKFQEELRRRESTENIDKKDDNKLLEVEKLSFEEIIADKQLALCFREFLHKHLNNEVTVPFYFFKTMLINFFKQKKKRIFHFIWKWKNLKIGHQILP